MKLSVYLFVSLSVSLFVSLSMTLLVFKSNVKPKVSRVFQGILMCF